MFGFFQCEVQNSERSISKVALDGQFLSVFCSLSLIARLPSLWVLGHFYRETLMKKPRASKKKAEVQSAPQEGSPSFPIVGIGASAGGLAAFQSFFTGMPADHDPGMAFVLVQHLAPDHASILTELIQRYTRMQVLEVNSATNYSTR